MAVERRFNYPPAHQSAVVEDFHGTLVPDPYDWLADPDAPATQQWVAAQNSLSSQFLHGLPEREEIRQRLSALWNYDQYSAPVKAGGRYFFTKQSGLQNQAVVYRLDDLAGSPVMVLDPNTLSTDGTVALETLEYSTDGRFLAYGASEAGSDWQTIRIRQLEDGSDLPEVLRWTKFVGIAWRPDSSGFFYNRFPDPALLPEAEQGLHQAIYWHQLGTPQSADVLIYSDPEHPERLVHPIVTDDGAYLLLHISRGTDPCDRMYYRPIDSNEPFVRLLDANDAKYVFVTNIGSRFIFQTNHSAPRGRIIAIDLDRPTPTDWQELVAASSAIIDGVCCAYGELVVLHKRDVHHELDRFDLEGAPLGSITLPTFGKVHMLKGQAKDHEIFCTFDSVLYPSTVFRFDFLTEQLDTFGAAELSIDTDAYEMKQIFYPSKDGTKVPMFVIHKKDIVLDGRNPTLMYGYGGFNISIMPSFALTRLIWLERGGVYVLTNLRGGDEYGEDWHTAGRLEHKQTVFDDFIAAGEWLIANGYTQPRQLGIIGGSNGGLLVAACMIQRPDLFGAVCCQVPVIDMLHYHKWTVGHYWIGEYGNAEADPDHFRFMFAYSPLHNIQAGTSYPPTLITSADVDDRVVPTHAKKFAAALQAADAGKHPILLRVEARAGHGHGKPTAKQIEEASDIFGFLAHMLR